ncbi:hypothetical protein FBU31_005553, partial [Coemansia sp. 'formosensis']
MHRDAYWFEQCPNVSYEDYALGAMLEGNEKSALAQLLVQTADMFSDAGSVEAPSLDYCPSSIDLECDSTAVNEPEAVLDEKGADLCLLSDCEPNIIRSPNDLYTPRWMRGIGKSKEGLCPVCYGNGKQNWKRMKCSAY